jgi:serine/threonine protein kinase
MSEPVIAGKYQVLSKLGEGTFGTVLLVQHTELSTKYALKILKRELSNNEQFVSRFKREAEILLKFYHSGSVQLRDFGKTADGLYYMATDFCEGQLLETVLANVGRFEVSEALKITHEILEILSAAHEFGIVHQDIKPSNIMINESATGKRQIQILDFGIASLREEALSSSGANTKSDEKPFHYGTPVYMAPEQCAGELDLDFKVDLYACGIILYEMLTSWVPFDSQDILQILLKHLTQPVPPFPKQLGIPLSVEEILFKALEKEKSKRFSSAKEFAEACLAQINLIKPSQSSPKLEKLEAVVATPKSISKNSDRRILCLDDNEMILQIMQHLLQKEGYHVFIADNFANIHDYVFQENVPLLICDVNMPGLPGNKICQMLKKAKPDLKIVLFSNIPERDLERLAKESKADDWLSKNSKPNAWLEKINTFF